MDPDHVLASMSAPLLRDWLAFESLEPPTADRLEWMLAQLTALVANAVRDTDKRPTAWTPGDFIPDYGSTEEERAEKQAGKVKTQMAGVRLKRHLMGG